MRCGRSLWLKYATSASGELVLFYSDFLCIIFRRAFLIECSGASELRPSDPRLPVEGVPSRRRPYARSIFCSSMDIILHHRVVLVSSRYRFRSFLRSDHYPLFGRPAARISEPDFRPCGLTHTRLTFFVRRSFVSAPNPLIEAARPGRKSTPLRAVLFLCISSSANRKRPLPSPPSLLIVSMRMRRYAGGLIVTPGSCALKSL
jgi:hypothetical protein